MQRRRTKEPGIRVFDSKHTTVKNTPLGQDVRVASPRSARTVEAIARRKKKELCRIPCGYNPFPNHSYIPPKLPSPTAIEQVVDGKRDLNGTGTGMTTEQLRRQQEVG